MEQNGQLSWQFFRPEGAFWQGFSEGDRKKYMHFFDHVLGQAAHTICIPDTLDLNPVYMQDTADAINIWRGRHLQKQELIEERTIRLGTGFSFSDYIDYLCVLPFDSLVALTNSDENEHFRHSCESFSMQQLSLREVEHSYRDYRRMIDLELLRHYRAIPRSGGKTDLRAFLQRTKDESVETGVEIVCEELLGSVIPFWKLGLALFYRLLRGEWRHEEKMRLIREGTSANMAGEIQRLQGEAEKLRQEVISDTPGIQDRHVKFDSNEVDADVCVTGPSNTS